jgi:hypothetical protein
MACTVGATPSSKCPQICPWALLWASLTYSQGIKIIIGFVADVISYEKWLVKRILREFKTVRNALFEENLSVLKWFRFCCHYCYDFSVMLLTIQRKCSKEKRQSFRTILSIVFMMVWGSSKSGPKKSKKIKFLCNIWQWPSR